MKKIVNIFLFLGLFMIFIININAKDDDLSPTSQEQVAKQKAAIEDYCDENAKLSGCIYDKNSTIYTDSKEVRYGVGVSEAGVSLTESYLMPAGVKLTRGYQTFDGNGNAVFAGCYRYQKSSGTNTDGTYFIFQIVYGDSSGKNCKVRHSFAIPASGITQYIRGTKWNGKDFLWNQTEWGGFFSYPALMNNWTAINNGDCPKVFGYTANVSWYTANNNKYIFSENTGDFNIDTISFISGEPYKARPGCTVEDVDGKEKAQELLNQILNQIKNKSCPAKIEDMNSYESEFESWYKSIRENNEYRVLWSAGLIDEVTKKSAETQIYEAIKNKIKECQYQICKISSTQKTKIEQNLGSTCKNGCTLSNVKTQSEDSNAKCYCCGSSQGCVLEWKVADSNTSRNCSLQSDIPKVQCIGTSAQYQCRKCLNEAYEKAGLSDDQKVCMAGNDIAALITQLNLEKANDDAADEDVKQEIEENRETRESIYERMGRQPVAPDFGFPESASCEEILGKNLTKLVKVAITIIQIVGAIVAIVKGMVTLIPAIASKDTDGLKKAEKQLVLMAIILIVIFLLKPLVSFIGELFDYDLTCIL